MAISDLGMREPTQGLHWEVAIATAFISLRVDELERNDIHLYCH